MKKAHRLLFIFLMILFSGSLWASAEKKNLVLNFRVEGGLGEKEAQLFGGLIRFWIEEETPYQISAASDLMLEMSLIQKSDQYLLQAALTQKSTGETHAHGQQFFNQLSDFPKALNQIFYHRIFMGQTLNVTTAAPSYDFVFALDSSGGMKEEAQALKENIRDIFSALCENLSHGVLRFAFMDYKNPASAYRVRLVNFASGNEKILARLKELQAFGKEAPDLEYALYHLLRYGDFKSEHRLVFLLTDTAPKNPQKVLDMLGKLTGMKIRIYVLMADGMSEKDQIFYQELSAKTGGKALPVGYTLNYLLKDRSMRTFKFEDFFVSENRKDRMADLSLGRKVRNLSEVPDFLQKEGFALLELKKLSLNLSDLIHQILKPLAFTGPKAVFRYQDQEIRVAMTDSRQIKALQNHYRKPVVIGGHFFSAEQGMGIFSHTFKLRLNPVPPLLLQNPSQIEDNPFFYFNTGLFNPPIWFVPAVFQGFME